ncbi:MAG: NADH-quinone oxidoreductase subunit C [Rickettsiaceae bacterium]|nr:NADH-quinone oxidoreductase subunit C [Rickettsiaceae bacterium]
MKFDIKKIIDDIIKEYEISAEVIESFCLNINTSQQYLIKLLKQLKSHKDLRFTILTDLFAADFPSKKERFEIVYNLLSLKNNTRLIIKIYTSEKDIVPSVADVFDSSVWFEREIFDMFGVKFKNNPDFRRILTDYGFSGHPLRKDFPLSGYVQVRYDEKTQKVINEPVKLQQDFRDFDFMSPWQSKDSGPAELLRPTLPGDEKVAKNKV